jgi:hypothetical protein
LFGRTLRAWDFRWKLRRAKRRLKGITRDQLILIDRLFNRRRELREQIASLMFVRKVLSLWHAIHVPLGMTLFATAFIHILLSLYYVTLAK